ncbi:putative regulatory protein [Deinococcus grandis]|uniref:Putative regulatory protein n=1 Tax=Deinococcus grandis TaxID=57498 RepID=A0A117DMY7_9DEIO|nr:hypothetical protein [Deinococcus grandis]BBN95722.1 hypothetical protein DEGR_24550 [Deinococcus grandis]GAQ20792.1 putative regulatory protein [Deinococcus grandis]
MTPAQPRHPLALLADGWEIEGAQLCDGVHASVPNAHAGQAYLDCAAQLREALRAQAEADQDLRQAARTLHMYSRRYCDGRSTYAPDDHNRATHTLLRLGVVLDADPISKTGPFAADGMYGLTEREHAALAQAQAGAGSVGGEAQ